MSGMMMCLTSASMILAKAAPITTATARAMTLPLNANSLNSFQSEVFLGGGAAAFSGSMGTPFAVETWVAGMVQVYRRRASQTTALPRVFVLGIPRLACVTMAARRLFDDAPPIASEDRMFGTPWKKFVHPAEVYNLEYPAHWDQVQQDEARSCGFGPHERDDVGLWISILPMSVDTDRLAEDLPRLMGQALPKFQAGEPRRDTTLRHYGLKADIKKEGEGGH